MASSFSLIDHLQPCLAILPSSLCLCLGHRRHGQLLHSPAPSTSDLLRYDAEERHTLLPQSSDALSLHSVTGQARPRAQTASQSPLHRPTRWHLFKSWWSPPRHNRSFIFDVDDDAELLPGPFDDDSAVDLPSRDQASATGTTMKPARDELRHSLLDPTDLPTLAELDIEEEKLAELEEGIARRRTTRKGPRNRAGRVERELVRDTLQPSHTDSDSSEDIVWQEYQSAELSSPETGCKASKMLEDGDEDEDGDGPLPDLGDTEQFFASPTRARRQGGSTRDDRSTSSYTSTSASSSGRSRSRRRQRRRAGEGETVRSDSTAPTSVRSSETGLKG